MLALFWGNTGKRSHAHVLLTGVLHSKLKFDIFCQLKRAQHTNPLFQNILPNQLKSSLTVPSFLAITCSCSFGPSDQTEKVSKDDSLFTSLIYLVLFMQKVPKYFICRSFCASCLPVFVNWCKFGVFNSNCQLKVSTCEIDQSQNTHHGMIHACLAFGSYQITLNPQNLLSSNHKQTLDPIFIFGTSCQHTIMS